MVSMMLAMNEMQLRIKKRSQESCQEHLLRCTGSKEDKGVSDMKMGTSVIFFKNVGEGEKTGKAAEGEYEMGGTSAPIVLR